MPDQIDWLIQHKVHAMSATTAAILRAVRDSITQAGPPSDPQVRRWVAKYARALDFAQNVGAAHVNRQLKNERKEKK